MLYLITNRTRKPLKRKDVRVSQANSVEDKQAKRREKNRNRIRGQQRKAKPKTPKQPPSDSPFTTDELSVLYLLLRRQLDNPAAMNREFHPHEAKAIETAWFKVRRMAMKK